MKTIKIMFILLMFLIICSNFAYTESEYIRLNEKGFKLIKQERYKKSIDYFKRSILLNSDYTVAYNNLGSAYYNLKEYDKAIDNFKKVISQENNYVKAYINLAACYFWKNKFHTAFNYYLKSMNIDEQYVKKRLENSNIKQEIEKAPENKKFKKVYNLYSSNK